MIVGATAPHIALGARPEESNETKISPSQYLIKNALYDYDSSVNASFTHTKGEPVHSIRALL